MCIRSGIDTLKNVDGAGNAGATEIVCQANCCTAHSVRVLAAKLKNAFVDLSKARRTNRMSLRKQSATRIDRDIAANLRSAFQRIATTMAARHNPEVLRIDDLGDREAIVQLHEVDLIRADPRL